METVKRLLLSLLISVLIFGGFPIFTNALGFGIPFGGRILSVTYCTCSFSLMVSVGPPRGGTFIYQPGLSRLYSYYRIFSSGPWVLGTATGNSTCLIYSGNSCVPVGAGLVMRLVGTSLN